MKMGFIKLSSDRVEVKDFIKKSDSIKDEDRDYILETIEEYPEGSLFTLDDVELDCEDSDIKPIKKAGVTFLGLGDMDLDRVEDREDFSIVEIEGRLYISFEEYRQRMC